MTAPTARRGSLLSSLGQTLNQHFGVALDNQLITVPYIDYKQYPDGINGDSGGELSGGFSIISARDLANELRLGALPLNLKLICHGTRTYDTVPEVDWLIANVTGRGSPDHVECRRPQ